MARVMLRANGNRGFLFVNNYVRQHGMPERRGFQTRIQLPSGTAVLPRTPIDIPAGSHFIWPVNLDLGAGTLQSSTAQLLSRFDWKGESTWFFFAIPGLRVEFDFDAIGIASVKATSGLVTRTGDSILVRGAIPGKDTVLEVAGKNGRNSRIVLLSEAEAEQFWRVQLGGADTVMLSPADVFAGSDGIHLRSTRPASIAAALYAPSRNGRSGHLWQDQHWKIEPRKIDFDWLSERKAATRPPIRTTGGPEPRAQAPDDRDFAGSAAWTLRIPAQSMAGLSDIFLRIHYAGDVARLYQDGLLLDDNFYNGGIWEIGLKRFLPGAFARNLEVDVLPLTRKAPIYLDSSAWEPIQAEGQTASVLGVEVLPEYEVVLGPVPPR